MSLTQFLNQSLAENSSLASTFQIQAEDLSVVQSGRNDASVELSNDTQTKLDAIRRKFENQAENLIPGLLNAAFGDQDSNRTAPVEESAVKSEEQAEEKSEESSVVKSEALTAVEEPGTVSSLISAISRWSIWEKVGLSKPEAKDQVQESVAATFDTKTLLRLFQNSLFVPTVQNLIQLQHYIALFYNEIDIETVRDVVLTAIKMGGCSEKSPARYDMAVYLISRFYSKMSDPSRLALFHYAMTSHNQDIFRVLASTHHALPKPTQDSQAALFIVALINKVSAQPELFDNFKDHLYWESYYEAARMLRDEPSLPAPSLVSLDEEPFMKQMTHCYNMVQSQEPVEPKSLEVCVNAARIEGYRKRPI